MLKFIDEYETNSFLLMNVNANSVANNEIVCEYVHMRKQQQIINPCRTRSPSRSNAVSGVSTLKFDSLFFLTFLFLITC